MNECFSELLLLIIFFLGLVCEKGWCVCVWGGGGGCFDALPVGRYILEQIVKEYMQSAITGVGSAFYCLLFLFLFFFFSFFFLFFICPL